MNQDFSPEKFLFGIFLMWKSAKKVSIHARNAEIANINLSNFRASESNTKNKKKRKKQK